MAEVVGAGYTSVLRPDERGVQLLDCLRVWGWECLMKVVDEPGECKMAWMWEVHRMSLVKRTSSSVIGVHSSSCAPSMV